MNEYFVYALQDENGRLYKGMTGNLEKRLKQHKAGQCQSTRLMKGINLVFAQVCSSREEARVLERYIKSGYGRETLREILGK